MNKEAKVSVLELLRGAVAITPRLHIANKGLAMLPLVRSGQRRSIGRLVEHWARRRADAIALQDHRQRLTYREYNAAANRHGALLARCGVGAGDVVAVLMQNRVEVITLVTGSVKLGAAAGMLNYQQRGDVLAHSLSLVEPRALVVGTECRDAFETVRDHLPESLGDRVFWLADGEHEPIEGLRDLAGESAAEPARNPATTGAVTTSDAAFHIFTSGTTGMPKAAVMSHGRWLRAMYGVGLASMRMRHDDVLYCPLPLYHNNALTLSWGAVLGAGATLAIGRKFSASGFWDEAMNFDATAFVYIGELCRYLLEQPQRPVERGHRIRVCLGNGLRPELWDRFKQRFAIPHINEFYGASECNLVFTNSFNISRSCGFCPLSYAVVEYDPDTEQPRRNARGRLLKVRRGQPGLLLSRVTRLSPFDGYTDQGESEKKLLRDGFRKGDCWFNTGDLVRPMGFRHVQFVDRLGDTYRWKGENVATTEVEQVMHAAPMVDEAVVYGVEVPGHEGRAGMAAVTLRHGNGHLDGAALARHLRDALPAYAVPLFLRMRNGHETTSTCKYRKTDLKRQGFDPEAVSEPVYVLRDREQGYEPLTADMCQAIRQRKLTL
ncbi:MAG: long-chain-acyl-CoA synthetase [Ectothiorhodospiraceae bacterium]|nr:long-chain-acyl-CoA synthetase [Ectothiorhodospiraceae bacterium]